MSLFVLSDTHLSKNADKPMDIFGARWTDHAEKLKTRWNRLVTPDDTVVIAGDISWALTHTDALADLTFLHELNGEKIIGRGNHDFWWTSLKKLNSLCEENHLSTLHFLHNNAFEIENFLIAGSRGWFVDESNRTMPENADYQKIVAREAIRLSLSLDEAVKLREKAIAEGRGEKEILVFLHFPPEFKDYTCPEIIDVLKKYQITRCFYGHIHGVYDLPRSTESNGIRYTITSADYLDFYPLPILPLPKN